MKAKIVNRDDGTLYGWRIECPGCGDPHVLVAKMNDGSPGWTFDGDLERPTFSPSLLCRWRGGRQADGRDECCHSFIRDGRIEFLGDCTHALAGQTVDLPELTDGADHDAD